VVRSRASRRSSLAIVDWLIWSDAMPSTLTVLAAALIALSGGIALRQRRARTCPRHGRFAGFAAWLLAVACGLGGAVLLAVSLLW